MPSICKHLSEKSWEPSVSSFLENVQFGGMSLFFSLQLCKIFGRIYKCFLKLLFSLTSFTFKGMELFSKTKGKETKLSVTPWDNGFCRSEWRSWVEDRKVPGRWYYFLFLPKWGIHHDTPVLHHFMQLNLLVLVLES